MRFGARGRQICNLCTAGYFDDFLPDVYNEDKTAFTDIYEALVNGVYTEFVNQHMTKEILSQKLMAKLERCERYGVPFFRVHGLGKANTKLIEEVISEQKNVNDFFEKNIYKSGNGNLTVVELILRDTPPKSST